MSENLEPKPWQEHKAEIVAGVSAVGLFATVIAIAGHRLREHRGLPGSEDQPPVAGEPSDNS